MCDKEDYLTAYREFFENFATTVNPEDQLPVQIAGYTITESELPGEVISWTTQYLTEKQCPPSLLTPLRRIILDEVRVAAKTHPNDFGFVESESEFIALRLMQAVTARVNEVCLRYLDNAKLDTLPPPPRDVRQIRSVSAALKNSRRVMEDRHVEIENLEALFGNESTEKTSFYAVYDGHAGSAAAVYCAAHLHQYLIDSPHYHTDLKKALNEAFLRTDAEFIRKVNQQRAKGGSTAVVVVVRGKTLYVAWAGDSQALLAKRMRLMQLVHPHRPSREDEMDRIEASGGTVLCWGGMCRVNGQLAISRAIGDEQYKPYVTAQPDIDVVDLDGDEDFVVLACDGLWDYVSEDEVAASVYWQLAADPDDLKAVTKSQIVQAKRLRSTDNISVIVVFLKDPRQIVADNCSPMDLGLDNALASAPPPFAEPEACKRLDVEALDNGVDNSDSDSEDLGPETAVDADADADADDVDAERHEPPPVTPPANVEEESHIAAELVDNVGESGDESEDEWNYFKGEGERDQPLADEQPHSETPCQDNSAWESSSVDMNSSPLNPDAPVFIPGSVAGNDVLLAESPRKPLPMDDIELPDAKQFETEAVVRPKEMDLDNCDKLNGHHNISLDEAAKLNGNDKCNMDSLGFGFSVGVDPDKNKESNFIQDFERIQKDTTDFCNIQVFQTHTETNPFSTEGNEELLERLKNKERDPMSMSFYQEKDDDTCERLTTNEPEIDLNSVQPLPDSEDEDMQSNGVYDNIFDKENICPDKIDLFNTENGLEEPNNDNVKMENRTGTPENNLVNLEQNNDLADINISSSNNMPNISFDLEVGIIPQETVQQTDTPESHKLMFEQIPEIPDGKSSELDFIVDDVPDPESEKDRFTPQDETSQDVEMESKLDDSPLVDVHPSEDFDQKDELVLSPAASPLHPDDDKDSGVTTDSMQALDIDNEVHAELVTPTDENKIVSLEPSNEDFITEDLKEEQSFAEKDMIHEQELPHEQLAIHEQIVNQGPEISHLNEEPVVEITESPLQAENIDLLMPSESPALSTSPQPSESVFPVINSPLPVESEQILREKVQTEQVQTEHIQTAVSPEPVQKSELTQHYEDLLTAPVTIVTETSSKESPVPPHSPITIETASLPRDSPLPSASPIPSASPLPVSSPLPSASPQPVESIPATENVQDIHNDVVVVPSEESLSQVTPAPDIVPEPSAELNVSEPQIQEISAPVINEVPQDVTIPSAAVAATAVVATAAAVAVSASKTPAKKTPSVTSKTTPKPSPSPRTPASTTKRPTTTPAKVTPAKPASKPTSTTPKPAGTIPKTATAKSANSIKPASTTTKPTSATTKLASTTARPASTTTKLASTTRPASTTTKPASTTRPASTTTKLASATTKHASTTTRVSAITKSTVGTVSAAPRTSASTLTKSVPKSALSKEPVKSASSKEPVKSLTARPLTSRPLASRPAATKPAATKPAAPKPSTTKPAGTKLEASKPPATRPPPISRAPRPASATAKPASVPPAPRAAPRTAPTKAPVKSSAPKPVSKRIIQDAPKKSENMNGVTNGDVTTTEAATLPDVIA